MVLQRKSGWLTIIGLFGMGILSLGVTKKESISPQKAGAKAAQAIHVDARFDAAFHGVVEEIRFSDVGSF